MLLHEISDWTDAYPSQLPTLLRFAG